MDRHRLDGDVPLIRERGFHPEQLTVDERREFAERLREDEELRATSYGARDYGRGDEEPRVRW
jgi:hypothetical protein